MWEKIAALGHDFVDAHNCGEKGEKSQITSVDQSNIESPGDRSEQDFSELQSPYELDEKTK